MASIFAYFFDGSNVPQDTLTVSYTLDEINSSGAFVANVATGTMTKTANAGEYLLVYTRDTSKYYVARIDGSATATNRYQGTIINARQETQAVGVNYGGAWSSSFDSVYNRIDSIKERLKDIEEIKKTLQSLPTSQQPVDIEAIKIAVQQALKKKPKKVLLQSDEANIMKFIDDTEKEVNIMKIMDDIDTEKRLLEFISQY